MFDHYEPVPPVCCPKCGAELREWQGKDGPCVLLCWKQGEKYPVGGLMSADSDEKVEDRSTLPETFGIYTSCGECRAWIDATCRGENYVWSRTEVSKVEVHPERSQGSVAPGLPDSAPEQNDGRVRVLIVYHSPGGNTRAAAEAVAEGVKAADAHAVLRPARWASSEDIIACDAIAAGTPDYFSYMTGMMKDFFDRTFNPTHGGDGRAVESMRVLCDAFGFKRLGEPLLVRDRPDEAATKQLRALGESLVAAAKR
jgi:hypothetical protein